MAKQRGYPDRRGMGAESDAISELFVPNERHKAQQRGMVETLTAAGLNPQEIASMLSVPVDLPPAEGTKGEEPNERSEEEKPADHPQSCNLAARSDPSPVVSYDFMHSSRRALLSLLARKSFRLGEFKLSSGGTSDYYIDCRTTTLDAQGSRLTGEVFLAEILQQNWKPAAIGGLTMGADPIVTSVSVVSGELHGFLVRKSEKQHGTGQRLEGFREKGARVVIVDDVCTTGASTIQAIEAARDFGFVIAGAMCLVEREEAGGRPNVEKAAAPAPFVSIFTANEVRGEHIRQNAKQ
jgi:orotate phosphoribosyltransferase